MTDHVYEDDAYTESCLAAIAREEADAGRDYDPDADDGDEEDPTGSNVPN